MIDTITLVTGEEPSLLLGACGPDVVPISTAPTAPTARGVYAVRYGQHIKVGRAENIRQRLSGLQCAIPEHLSFVGVLSWDPDDEDKFHRQFAHLRSRGEWFRADEIIYQAVRQASAGAQ